MLNSDKGVRDLMVIYEWKYDILPPQHVDFRVIKFTSNGKGEVVCDRLCHQKEHRNMLLSELPPELTDLGASLDQSRFPVNPSLSLTAKADKIKLKYMGLRFLGDGTLLSVAYFIRQHKLQRLLTSKTAKN